MLLLESPPPPGPRSKAHANAVGSEPVQSRTQGPSGTRRPGLWLGDSPASWWSYSSLLFCSQPSDMGGGHSHQPGQRKPPSFFIPLTTGGMVKALKISKKHLTPGATWPGGVLHSAHHLQREVRGPDGALCVVAWGQAAGRRCPGQFDLQPNYRGQ